MSRDEEQTKKSANNNNLKIAHQGQQNTQMRNPFFGGDLIVRQPQQNQMRNPFFGGDLIVRQPQQNQMGNPFYGPALGLMSSQGQMMGLSTRKGGGFTYNPWNLQINPVEQAKRKSA